MAGKKTLVGQLANAIVKRHPKVGSLTLAKMLRKESPAVFTSAEQARTAVRYARAAQGAENRQYATCPRSQDDAEQCRTWGALLPDSAAITWGWRELPSGVKRWLILADLHIPYHDKAALTAALQHAEGQCDGILLLGDLVDCVTPDTKILTYDLRWVSAGSLVIGDELIGFDEQSTGAGKDGRNLPRKLRRAIVESVHRLPQPVVALTMDDGTVLKCTPNHKWFGWTTSKTRGMPRWITAAEIASRVAQGKQVLLNRPVKPWTCDNDYDSGYLAAAFDGEGHITFNRRANNFAHLAFTQRPNEFLCNVEEALTRKGFCSGRQESKSRSTAVLHVRGGMWAFAEFVGRFNIQRFREKWVRSAPVDGYQLASTRRHRVVSVAFVGVEDIIALQTSSKTYLAEGFCSHNCYQLSSFCRDPRKRDFEAEVADVQRFLDALDSFPGIKAKVFKQGNHELRLERYLMQRAPELKTLCEQFSWRSQLHLDERGIVSISPQDPIRHHKLAIIHGHEWGNRFASPVNAARGAFLKAHECTLEGHGHRTSEHAESTLFGTTIHCWSVGCLCDLHPTYRPLGNKWNHGFAYLNTGSDWSITNHTIINGKVL